MSQRPRRSLPPRIRVFGVGAPKTGTTSIARLFSGYRSFHEVDADAYASLLADRWPIASSDEVVARYLATRDRRYQPEVDSASMNGVCSQHLRRLAPDARFILTVRDPVRWLASITDHVHGRSASASTVRYREARFGRHDRPCEEDRFAVRGLYPLRGYLTYWGDHNRTVLEAVPPDQLLIVPTESISQHIPEIATFARASPRRVSADRAHDNRSPNSFSILDDLPRGYLQAMVREVCDDVLREMPPL